MSSNSNSSNAGDSSKPYIVTGSGTNSQGNHWCNRESSAGSGYHYSNSDGSYYYSNPDWVDLLQRWEGLVHLHDPFGTPGEEVGIQ
ncbi:hypothetical protein B0H11DRAFT_251627 [Mycena galericulata]|nr:hypothetical protein B0H11DRAFT_251627 [Mycena galericulata]